MPRHEGSKMMDFINVNLDETIQKIYIAYLNKETLIPLWRYKKASLGKKLLIRKHKHWGFSEKLKHEIFKPFRGESCQSP